MSYSNCRQSRKWVWGKTLTPRKEQFFHQKGKAKASGSFFPRWIFESWTLLILQSTFKSREEGEMSELRICLRINQTSIGKLYSDATSCLLICFPPCGICKRKPAYAKHFMYAQMSWQWPIRVKKKKKRNKKKQTVRKINNSEIRPTGHKSIHIVKSQKQKWLRLEADVWSALKWIWIESTIFRRNQRFVFQKEHVTVSPALCNLHRWLQQVGHHGNLKFFCKTILLVKF